MVSVRASQIPRRPDPDGLREGSQRKSGQSGVAHPRGRRTQARRSSAFRNCSARSISAAKRAPTCSTWRRPSPAPPRESFSRLAAELDVVIVGSVFERRAAGVYHNTALVIDADGSAAGPLSQDAHPRRSAVLREILLHARRPGLPLLRHPLCAHRAAGVLGPVVSRRRRAWRRWAARRCCSIPPPSAGILRKSSSTAGRSTMPGAPSRAPHAIANGVVRGVGESRGL